MRWLAIFSVIFLSMGCADDQDLAREAVEATVLSKYQVRYKSVADYPGKIVCGEYEVLDEWGQSGGLLQFIYRSSQLETRVKKDDWAIFCSEDAGGQLYEKTAIRATAIDSKTLDTLRADFLALEAASKTKKPEDVETPEDPWGTPYFYIEPWFGGVQAEIKFKSFGADGVEGGKDENADIGNWQIKYIDHIRQL